MRQKKKEENPNAIHYQYEIWMEDGSFSGWYRRENRIATTPSKAKYDYYLEILELWCDLTFQDFVKRVRCRKIGVANVSCLFGNAESFDRMCKMRNLPFVYQGMRIEVAGKLGTIVGSNRSLNLDVVFDGEWISANCHPWWQTRYFDRNGEIAKDYVESA